MNKLGHTLGAGTTATLMGIVAVKYGINLSIFTQIHLLPHTQFGDFVLNITGTVLFFIVLIISNFIPDMDAEYSYIRSKIPLLPKIYTAIQSTFEHTPLNSILKHRGALFHSLWTLILISIFMVYTGLYTLCIAMMVGIFTHHVLDMVTPAGLRYFYPFRLNLFRCLRNKSC